jgi:hypothetical protein
MWEGFTCRECQDFQPQKPWNAEEAQQDADRCRALLFAIKHHRLTSAALNRLLDYIESERVDLNATLISS